MSNVTSIFGGNNHSVFGGYGPADFEVASVPLMYFDDNDGWHPSSKIVVVRTSELTSV